MQVRSVRTKRKTRFSVNKNRDLPSFFLPNTILASFQRDETSSFELGNQNGGALLKSTISAQEGKLASFPPVAQQLRVVVVVSALPAPLASPFSALQAPTSATPLSSKCVSSPRNGRSQSAALGRPKKNITVKIRFFHHWYFHLNINRRNNLTCFLHAFLNLLNQWNL